MKQQLLNHLANAEMQLTFDALKSKGANISGIEKRYNGQRKFEDLLLQEKKQYTSGQHKAFTKKFIKDNWSLIKLVKLLF